MTTNIFISQKAIDGERRGDNIGNTEIVERKIGTRRHPFTVLFVISIMFIGLFSVAIGPFSVNVSAATTYTWDAPGAGIASLDTNWDPVAVPGVGDAVVFDGTSTFACSWDVATNLETFSMDSGYSGVVTLAEDLTVTDQVSINAGTLTGSAIYNITFEKEFHQNAGTISGDSLQIIADGSPAYLNTTSTLSFRAFRASSDVIIKPITVIVMRSITVDIGCTMTIDAGGIRSTPYFLWGFSNSGTIDEIDSGTLQIMNRASAPKTITFGTINCPVSVFGDASTTGDVALTLATDTVIGGYLQVWSLHATYNCTLDLDGHDLTADGILVSTRGILDANSGTITNNGDWDSSNGVLSAGTSTLIMSDHLATLETASGSDGELYSLQISESANALSSIDVDHDLIIAAAKTFTIDSGFELDYNCSGGGTYSNLGFLMGQGNTIFSFDTADKSMTFGVIRTDVIVRATSDATGDRMLTMETDTSFGNYLTVVSEHPTYLMIFNSSAGNVSIHLDYIDGANSLVIFTYAWSVPSPNSYEIGIDSGNYYLENVVTGVIETTESTTTGFADNVTQHGINLCPSDGQITFLEGTFIFLCANDFYIGGWNYSAMVSTQQNMTISGSDGTMLKFRENLEVIPGNGVAIFLFMGDAQNATLQDLNFTVAATMVTTYSSGVFLDSFYSVGRFVNLTIQNCNFWNMSWGIWGDGWQGQDNLITNCLFYGVAGMALHNHPSDIVVSNNTFILTNVALMIDSVHNVTATGNTFIDCGSGVATYSVYIWDDVRDTQVSENEFYGLSQVDSRGIIIGNVAGKPDCSNIVLDNNAFSDFQYGIWARGGNYTYIRGNVFLNTTLPIADGAVDSELSGNVNYSYGSEFNSFITLTIGSIEFKDHTQFNVESEIALIDIILQEYRDSESYCWTTDTAGSDEAVIYTFRGLDPSVGYKVYIDNDDVLRQHSGTTYLSFTVLGSEYIEVHAWDPYGNFGIIATALITLGLILGFGAICFQILLRNKPRRG